MPDTSATDKRLIWANWPLYVDTDDDNRNRRPTLAAFEKRTGISVDYIEEINDNDEFFGKISQGNGVDITRWTADDFHRVCDQVERQTRRGQIRRFTGNDYTKDLVSGDVLARLLDYYFGPEAAAEPAAWVNYVCPVPAAKDVLAAAKDKDTAALADNPLIFPDDTMRRRLAVARDIISEERADFAKRWNRIAGL